MTTIVSRSADALISPGRRNIAIAEIVLFSIIHLIQLPLRYLQEWRYWHHSKRQSPGRCFFYSWWSMVGLLAQLRITSSAIILSNYQPNKPVLVAESAMRSVGLSPLLFEVSLALLECLFRDSGQSCDFGPGKSKYPKPLRFALHGFRFPIAIAIVLAVVGGIIEIPALGEAGSVLLIVTLVFVCGLVAWLAVISRSTLPVEGHRGVLLVLLALPLLLVKIIVLVSLLEYGSLKVRPSSGEGTLARIGFVMEIFVVVLLLAVRAVAMPILSVDVKPHIQSDDAEGLRN